MTIRVWSVAATPDEKIIKSGGDDGTIRLWERETGRGKAKTTGALQISHQLPDNYWVTVLDKNRYMASEGGKNYVTFTDRLANYLASDFPELYLE